MLMANAPTRLVFEKRAAHLGRWNYNEAAKLKTNLDTFAHQAYTRLKDTTYFFPPAPLQPLAWLLPLRACLFGRDD